MTHARLSECTKKLRLATERALHWNFHHATSRHFPRIATWRQGAKKIISHISQSQDDVS